MYSVLILTWHVTQSTFTWALSHYSPYNGDFLKMPPKIGSGVPQSVKVEKYFMRKLISHQNGIRKNSLHV